MIKNKSQLNNYSLGRFAYSNLFPEHWKHPGDTYFIAWQVFYILN